MSIMDKSIKHTTFLCDLLIIYVLLTYTRFPLGNFVLHQISEKVIAEFCQNYHLLKRDLKRQITIALEVYILALATV